MRSLKLALAALALNAPFSAANADAAYTMLPSRPAVPRSVGFSGVSPLCVTPIGADLGAGFSVPCGTHGTAPTGVAATAMSYTGMASAVVALSSTPAQVFPASPAPRVGFIIRSNAVTYCTWDGTAPSTANFNFSFAAGATGGTFNSSGLPFAPNGPVTCMAPNGASIAAYSYP